LRILVLSFYFEPDLSACSFRSTALVKSLSKKLSNKDCIEVITTMPNRYKSFRNAAPAFEENNNTRIYRISLSDFRIKHFDQAIAFISYWRGVKNVIENQKYDLVFVTSGRFFSAFLGAIIAKETKTPYYLDIRDILSDGISDIVNNKVVNFFLIPTIKTIEKFSVLTSTHLNLVSEGFKNSFKYHEGKTTFFTNGIDKTFLGNNFEKNVEVSQGKPKIITYAGNIGEGQGLEKIIPEAARRLRGKYIFNIIGDGGTKRILEMKLADLQIDNVNLVTPVNRNELIKYYHESDFLFLHLNNYEAFKKVLPSKIFEYGATKKPIIAGVDGYARKFIKEHLDDALIFEPTNVEEFIKSLENYEPIIISREEFIEKFKRDIIFDEMTESILELIPTRKLQLI
jgi:hypothetical protein